MKILIILQRISIYHEKMICKIIGGNRDFLDHKSGSYYLLSGTVLDSFPHYLILETRCTKFMQGARPSQPRLRPEGRPDGHSAVRSN